MAQLLFHDLSPNLKTPELSRGFVGMADWDRVPYAGDSLTVGGREYEVRGVEWVARTGLKLNDDGAHAFLLERVIVKIHPTPDQRQQDEAAFAAAQKEQTDG